MNRPLAEHLSCGALVRTRALDRVRGVAIALACSLVFAPIAHADVEPSNDRLMTAEGPAGSTIVGQLGAGDPADVYLVYLQGGMAVTYKNTIAAANGCVVSWKLADPELDAGLGTKDAPLNSGAVVPGTLPRLYIYSVSREPGSCPGNVSYALNFTTPGAVKSGPVFGALTPAAEGFNSPGSVFGPLTAGVLYTGVTRTDSETDYLYFYTSAPGQQVSATVFSSSGSCFTTMTWWRESTPTTEIASTSTGTFDFNVVRYTSPAPEKIILRIDTCTGKEWGVRFDSAQPLATGPAVPAASPPPAPAPPPAQSTKNPSLCAAARKARSRALRAAAKTRRQIRHSRRGSKRRARLKRRLAAERKSAARARTQIALRC